MNNLRVSGTFVVTALLCIWSMVASGEPIAFVGVSVVPMDSERILADQTVLIDDGRIITIGPVASTEIPTNALKIAGAGRYLLPGLTEMHAHIPNLGRGRAWVDDVLFLFVANGVTTARGMLGEPFHLDLREQTANGQTLGPRIYTSGPSLNGRSVDGPDTARRHHGRQTPSDGTPHHPRVLEEEGEGQRTWLDHHARPLSEPDVIRGRTLMPPSASRVGRGSTDDGWARMGVGRWGRGRDRWLGCSVKPLNP